MTVEQDLDMFGPPKVEDVTLDAMIAEIERELALRGRVYPRMVERGELTPKQANDQCLVLQAIRLKLLREREAAYRGR